MRQLTEDETRILFTKLAAYTGSSLKNLIAPSSASDDPSTNDSGSGSGHKVSKSQKPEQYCFRLHRTRVYYLPLSLANLATTIARDSLLSLGTCLGKFTKGGKFRLHITALEIIAPHARYRVWIKPNGEMPFLYGGHIVKAHIGRWSEDCPEHQGVVVCSMGDTPLGFGVSAASSLELRKRDPTAIAVFRQADVGEFLREEDTLFAGS